MTAIAGVTDSSASVPKDRPHCTANLLADHSRASEGKAVGYEGERSRRQLWCL